MKISHVIQLAILPVLILVSWESAVRFGFVSPAILPSPYAVVARIIIRLSDGSLLAHTGISLKRLSFGLVQGGLVGMVLAFACVGWPMVRRLTMPTVITVSPVPVLAWIPLLISLVGISSARTTLCAIGTFFTMFFGTLHGMQQVDRVYMDLAVSLNKTRLATLWHVLLPGAMPAVFHSFRLSLATGWILLLAGEVIASSSGLGWLIWDARNFQRPADLFAAIVTIGAIGALADSIALALQRWTLRWQASGN